MLVLIVMLILIVIDYCDIYRMRRNGDCSGSAYYNAGVPIEDLGACMHTCKACM